MAESKIKIISLGLILIFFFFPVFARMQTVETAVTIGPPATSTPPVEEPVVPSAGVGAYVFDTKAPSLEKIVYEEIRGKIPGTEILYEIVDSNVFFEWQSDEAADYVFSFVDEDGDTGEINILGKLRYAKILMTGLFSDDTYFVSLKLEDAAHNSTFYRFSYSLEDLVVGKIGAPKQEIVLAPEIILAPLENNFIRVTSSLDKSIPKPVSSSTASLENNPELQKLPPALTVIDKSTDIPLTVTPNIIEETTSTLEIKKETEIVSNEVKLVRMIDWKVIIFGTFEMVLFLSRIIFGELICLPLNFLNIHLGYQYFPIRYNEEWVFIFELIKQWKS